MQVRGTLQCVTITVAEQLSFTLPSVARLALACMCNPNRVATPTDPAGIHEIHERGRASLSCASTSVAERLSSSMPSVAQPLSRVRAMILESMDAMRACMYNRNTAVLPARSSISSKLNLQRAPSH